MLTAATPAPPGPTPMPTCPLPALPSAALVLLASLAPQAAAEPVSATVTIVGGDLGAARSEAVREMLWEAGMRADATVAQIGEWMSGLWPATNAEATHAQA